VEDSVTAQVAIADVLLAPCTLEIAI
jgi:hypothetical protein